MGEVLDKVMQLERVVSMLCHQITGLDTALEMLLQQTKHNFELKTVSDESEGMPEGSIKQVFNITARTPEQLQAFKDEHRQMIRARIEAMQRSIIQPL